MRESPWDATNQLIHTVGMFMSNPVMEALLRMRSGKEYGSSDTNVMDIVSLFTREEFEKWVKRFHEMVEAWILHTHSLDALEVAKFASNFDEIRALFLSWILTTDGVHEIFTQMLLLGKVTYKELTLDDRKCFWFDEIQMKSFIKYGSVVVTFSSDIQSLVADFLEAA